MHLSSVRQEIAQLETSLQQIGIRRPLRVALNAIQLLMHVRQLNLPDNPVELVTDEAIAQQLLISLFSKMAQEATQGQLTLHNKNHSDYLSY